MRSKNWQQVESIFHTALALGGDERISYLSEKCSGNTALLSEVESLLVAFENESGFLEDSAFSLGMNVLGQDEEKDFTGEKIGFYEIKEKLGGGGMGVVYLAEDTRLNRKVALKFLKKTFVDDKWAKKQFINEAQAVARLEHPNICAVHSIEEIDEHNFIVMQYIEGATLAEIIPARQLTLEKILSVVNQIVSAVASAHSHGIIHRDIKPGNIMITPEGSVKVLDFGLAKVVEHKQKLAEENLSQMSQNGLILGTVSYMSPEQLRGERLDYRTDIFSVGIVLYEMLTGKRPFHRNSQAETIAAILGDEPARLKEGKTRIPDALDVIVHKCLHKDKEKRFESAAEILVELDKAESANIRGTIPRRVKRFFAKAVLAAATAVLLVVLVFTFLYNGKAAPKTLAVLPISFENAPAEKEYLADGLTQSIIEKLSGLSDLKVKNGYSVASFRGKAFEPQKAGNELNVDSVLTGTIQKRGEDLFLVTKLIRTSDGLLIDPFETKIEEANLSDIEENISRRVIDKIQSNITADDKKSLEKKDTGSTEAKRLYLVGRFYLSRRQGEDLKNAERYFRESTNLDPSYAKAWSGLADTYSLFSFPGHKGSMPPQEALKSAREAAQRALDFDNTLCEPYNSLGMIKLRYEWDWSGAESYFRAAIDRDPEFPPAHLGLSNLMVIKGQFDEALKEAEKVKDISPLSVSADLNMTGVFYFRRDYEQMSRVLSESLDKYPNHIRLNYFRGLLFIETGKLQEATDIFERIYQEDKVLGAAPLGLVYAKTGRREEVRKILTTLDELSKQDNQDYIPSQERAIIYIALGDFDRVFENLQKACGERFPALPFVITDPIFDEIRTDTRFADIKNCVNL